MTQQERGSRPQLTVEGQRFAIIPEWIIDSDLGDAAFRLYAVLLRYGQSSGQRMPSRATLARRLRKRSVDTVDRALKELVELGAVEVERRRDGNRNLTNLYRIRTSPPGRSGAATPGEGDAGGARVLAGSRVGAATAGRSRAATVAGPLRPDPEPSTESTPPPIGDADAQHCQQQRRALGLPVTRWSTSALRAAAARAQERGWPTDQLVPALIAVARDPASHSPMRVAEAGPWWDEPPPQRSIDLSALEAELDALDGARVRVQRLARRQLADEGLPVTRATVVPRAVEIARAAG